MSRWSFRGTRDDTKMGGGGRCTKSGWAMREVVEGWLCHTYSESRRASSRTRLPEVEENERLPTLVLYLPLSRRHFLICARKESLGRERCVRRGQNAEKKFMSLIHYIGVITSVVVDTFQWGRISARGCHHRDCEFHGKCISRTYFSLCHLTNLYQNVLILDVLYWIFISKKWSINKI